MLSETKNAIAGLKLYGMHKTLERRLEEATSGNWGHTELLSSLVTDELHYRRQRSAEYRIKRARFRSTIDFDQFDQTAKRSLTKVQVKELKELGFIKNKQSLVLIGPTGVGKTFIASAIGHHACNQGYTSIFMGVNLLIEKIMVARSSGQYLRLRDQLIKCDLLILDDLGIKPLGPVVTQDLYDILEERYQTKSTLITTQLPLSNWKEVIEDMVALEAILDRLVHGMKIEITGESYRKKRGVDKVMGTSGN